MAKNRPDEDVDHGRRSFLVQAPASVATAAIATSVAPTAAPAMALFSQVILKATEATHSRYGVADALMMLGDALGKSACPSVPVTTNYLGKTRERADTERLVFDLINQHHDLYRNAPILERLVANCGDISATDLLDGYEQESERLYGSGNHTNSEKNLGLLRNFIKERNITSVSELLSQVQSTSQATQAAIRSEIQKLPTYVTGNVPRFNAVFEDEFKLFLPNTTPEELRAESCRLHDLQRTFTGVNERAENVLTHAAQSGNLDYQQRNALADKLNHMISDAVNAGETQDDISKRIDSMLSRIGHVPAEEIVDESFFTKPIKEIAPPPQLPAPTPTIYRSLQGFSVWEMGSDDGKRHYLIMPEKGTIPSAIKTKLENIFSTKGTEFTFSVKSEIDETLDSRNLQVITDSPEAIDTLDNVIEAQQARTRAH